MGSEPDFWVAVKNLQTNKLEVIEAQLLWNLHPDDSYSKFEPENCEDFRDDVKYGVIQGKDMALYYVQGMSVKKEEIMDRIHNKNHPEKIRNPKRLSCGEARIHLSKLVLASEKKDAKSSTKTAIKNAKKRGKEQNESRAIKTYKKLKNSQDKLDKSNSRPPSNSAKDGNSANDREDEKGVRRKENAEIAKSSFNLPPQEIPENEDKSPSPPEVKDSAATPCTGNCAMSQFLQQQLEEKQKELNKYTEEQRTTVERLAQELNNLEFRTPSPVCSSLAAAVDGISLPRENGENIPEGKIHIGDEVMLDINEISEGVEFKVYDLTKRVALILPFFYPNDLLRRAFDPKSIGPDALPISNSHVAVMTRILDNMAKNDTKGKSTVTENKVRSAIRHFVWRIRDTEKLNSLPAEEREMILKARREKSKQSREKKAAERNKIKNKNTKGKKALESSSSEEEEEDDEDEEEK